MSGYRKVESEPVKQKKTKVIVSVMQMIDVVALGHYRTGCLHERANFVLNTVIRIFSVF